MLDRRKFIGVLADGLVIAFVAPPVAAQSSMATGDPVRRIPGRPPSVLSAQRSCLDNPCSYGRSVCTLAQAASAQCVSTRSAFIQLTFADDDLNPQAWKRSVTKRRLWPGTPRPPRVTDSNRGLINSRRGAVDLSHETPRARANPQARHRRSVPSRRATAAGAPSHPRRVPVRCSVPDSQTCSSPEC